MYKLAILSIFCLAFGSSCNYKEREEHLQQWEEKLKAREQNILIKEKEVQLLEDDLKRKITASDSNLRAIADTIVALPDSIAGNWNVNMVCTETNCSGSAVGDIRKELWQLAGKDSAVTIRAMQGDKLVRIYTGIFTGTNIKLSTPQSENNQLSNTKMKVELQINSIKKLSGQRLITQADNCNTIYKIDMEKIKAQ